MQKCLSFGGHIKNVYFFNRSGFPRRSCQGSAGVTPLTK